MGKRTKRAKYQTEREKRLDNLWYVLFLSIAFAYLFYRIFFESTIIGQSAWMLYFNVIPMSAGMVVLVYCCRNWIKELSTSKDKFYQKLIGFIILIPCAILFLYVLIGFPANVIFDQTNSYLAKESRAEIVRSPVTDFHKRRGTRGTNRIYFHFKGNRESLRVSNATIDEFQNADPREYVMELNVRKGILGTYIVDDWDILAIKNPNQK